MALPNLADVHVLVVEDTDDSRDMLRAALESCGAVLTTAATATEAKRIIMESARPHVLLSDIALPDDGLELIREVQTISELLGEGFAELVEKPLDPIALCGIVRRHAQLAA